MLRIPLHPHPHSSPFSSHLLFFSQVYDDLQQIFKPKNKDAKKNLSPTSKSSTDKTSKPIQKSLRLTNENWKLNPKNGGGEGEQGRMSVAQNEQT